MIRAFIRIIRMIRLIRSFVRITAVDFARISVKHVFGSAKLTVLNRNGGVGLISWDVQLVIFGGANPTVLNRDGGIGLVWGDLGEGTG